MELLIFYEVYVYDLVDVNVHEVDFVEISLLHQFRPATCLSLKLLAQLTLLRYSVFQLLKQFTFA